LGLPLLRTQVHEAGAQGAAILAAAGAGLFPSVGSGVDAMVRLEQRFVPDPAKQAIYHERFAAYRAFAPVMEQTMRAMK
jgi:sugar (pentulose or hexulose) kinase